MGRKCQSLEMDDDLKNKQREVYLNLLNQTMTFSRPDTVCDPYGNYSVKDTLWTGQPTVVAVSRAVVFVEKVIDTNTIKKLIYS